MILPLNTEITTFISLQVYFQVASLTVKSIYFISSEVFYIKFGAKYFLLYYVKILLSKHFCPSISSHNGVSTVVGEPLKISSRFQPGARSERR